MIRQEALLPGTRAIPRGTVEFECRQKVLIRYKNLAGNVWQRQIEDREEAGRVFWGFVENLRSEAARARAEEEAGHDHL